MSNIYLQSVDETNETKVRQIKLNKEQEKFIETVDECLEEASECSAWCPVAIYDDEVIIGFAMYGSFGPHNDTWIDRIMIDEKYQGKGLGRAAMLKLIDVVSKKYDINEIYLSIIDGNEAAYNLYKSIGFINMNETDSNGEHLFKYRVK